MKAPDQRPGVDAGGAVRPEPSVRNPAPLMPGVKQGPMVCTKMGWLVYIFV
jgi:hypothetical protein